MLLVVNQSNFYNYGDKLCRIFFFIKSVKSLYSEFADLDQNRYLLRSDFVDFTIMRSVQSVENMCPILYTVDH